MGGGYRHTTDPRHRAVLIEAYPSKGSGCFFGSNVRLWPISKLHNAWLSVRYPNLGYIKSIAFTFGLKR
jgi:hypothetical protein